MLQSLLQVDLLMQAQRLGSGKQWLGGRRRPPGLCRPAAPARPLYQQGRHNLIWQLQGRLAARAAAVPCLRMALPTPAATQAAPARR